MQLISVQVGRPQTIQSGRTSTQTGIFKHPVETPIMLRRLNLDGDGQADLEAHGGPDKAVYAYPSEHYPVWATELKRTDLKYGQFGENFTISGLDEETAHIGDIFRIGQALVQVTQPRVPCFKLGIRMGDPTFVKRFLHSQRSGFYLRVLEEGMVQKGDAIQLVAADPSAMSVKEILHTYYFDRNNHEQAARAARLTALPATWREDFQKRIAQ